MSICGQRLSRQMYVLPGTGGIHCNPIFPFPQLPSRGALRPYRARGQGSEPFAPAHQQFRLKNQRGSQGGKFRSDSPTNLAPRLSRQASSESEPREPAFGEFSLRRRPQAFELILADPDIGSLCGSCIADVRWLVSQSCDKLAGRAGCLKACKRRALAKRFSRTSSYVGRPRSLAVGHGGGMCIEATATVSNASPLATRVALTSQNVRTILKGHSAEGLPSPAPTR